MIQTGLIREGLSSTVDIADVDPVVARTIPESLAWEFGALAIDRSANSLTVAFADNPSDGALRRLERATGLPLRIVIAPHDLIQQALARALGRNENRPRSGGAHDAPAVRALNELHERAFFEHSSDIHIEPQDEHTRVRFRKDGFLYQAERFVEPLSSAIVSRIKVLAGMDIADRRQPQDGRYTLRIGGHTLDARVSSVPTLDGENLVIRLLDHHVRLPAIDELGMSPFLRTQFSNVVESSSGFVVVCGPTGSGKTTTLYAALAQLNDEARAICTVEDPVEQAIEGITQVQVNVRAGVTFAAVLRAHLRQDPNVIMIGEMRDRETAETALAAALSGQLVFTTLHSTDAPRTIERLSELGVARTSMAAALTAILAQRLVRRLCGHCKVPKSISASAGRKYNLDPARMYFEPGGCERCAGVGFRNRIGIFELIVLNDTLRDELSSGRSSVRFADLAASSGYRKMREDCIEKLHDGMTSVSEYARVAHSAGGLS